MKEIGFEAASLASQYLHKHAARFGLDKDCVILDVGAGTGMVAHLVCIYIYHNNCVLSP